MKFGIPRESQKFPFDADLRRCGHTSCWSAFPCDPAAAQHTVQEFIPAGCAKVKHTMVLDWGF